ncbi:MAG: ATPase [Betaproteobacteria bacterium]|nr:ATPase [Betaproteobacteria bacterium]
MSAPLGLGLDAGGTTTRWALSDAEGRIVAEGVAAGMTGLQLVNEHGRAALAAALNALGAEVRKVGTPGAVCAGFTGLDQHTDVMAGLIANALGIDAKAVALKSDIEITYHDLFQPGEGYVVYAGTGTVAAFIDADGQMQRAGGRGAIIDDAGGGFWIAREALKHIWRAEDQRPGAWRESPLARRVFEHIGSADWGATRAFFYGKERGEIGQLARAVAAAAGEDPVALRLLVDAGRELARLAHALTGRFGSRPVALCGRVLLLHPAIEQSFREALPGEDIRVRIAAAHHAAAHIAARNANEESR